MPPPTPGWVAAPKSVKNGIVAVFIPTRRYVALIAETFVFVYLGMACITFPIFGLIQTMNTGPRTATTTKQARRVAGVVYRGEGAPLHPHTVIPMKNGISYRMDNGPSTYVSIFFFCIIFITYSSHHKS